MNTLKLLDLKPPVYFTDDVYIDKKFLLFIGETCFTEDLKRLLSEWQFTLFYSKGAVSENNPHKKAAVSPKTVQADSVDSRPPPTIGEAKLSGKEVEKLYQRFYEFTANVYDTYRTRQVLAAARILAKMKEFCSFIENNRNTVLILQSLMPYATDNMLATHSLRSAVFAVVIGMDLKLSKHQLAELATAALLHEIGLIHISEDIYLRADALSDEEKKYLYVYPMLSCKILKKAQFPLPICLGVFDHHERENGTGYPQRLKSEKISLYGKIIAVTCSYEMMIGERAHKKAYDPASALLNILRQSSCYDEQVLRALLHALSFFPIGSFVFLSDDSIAQVIDNNTEDPRFPIVRIISGSADANAPKALRTSMEGTRIIRPARREEWVLALGQDKRT